MQCFLSLTTISDSLSSTWWNLLVMFSIVFFFLTDWSTWSFPAFSLVFLAESLSFCWLHQFCWFSHLVLLPCLYVAVFFVWVMDWFLHSFSPIHPRWGHWFPGPSLDVLLMSMPLNSETQGLWSLGYLFQFWERIFYIWWASLPTVPYCKPTRWKDKTDKCVAGLILADFLLFWCFAPQFLCTFQVSWHPFHGCPKFLRSFSLFL